MIEQMYCPHEKRVTANKLRILRSVVTYVTKGLTQWVCLSCGEPRSQIARDVYT